jgi:hypothetical protein
MFAYKSVVPDTLIVSKQGLQYRTLGKTQTWDWGCIEKVRNVNSRYTSYVKVLFNGSRPGKKDKASEYIMYCFWPTGVGDVLDLISRAQPHTPAAAAL